MVQTIVEGFDKDEMADALHHLIRMLSPALDAEVNNGQGYDDLAEYLILMLEGPKQEL